MIEEKNLAFASRADLGRWLLKHTLLAVALGFVWVVGGYLAFILLRERPTADILIGVSIVGIVF